MNISLDEQQSKLQQEAQDVLDDINLLPILNRYAPAKMVGSVVTGLMTWRDIDIEVPKLISKSEVLDAIAPIWEQSSILECNLGDNRHKERPNAPSGFYVGLKYKKVMEHEEVVWKIDIWFLDPSQQSQELNTEWIQARLTPENRQIILAIKNVLAQHPSYRKQIYSVDIYNTVFEHDVRSIEDFKTFMQTKGVEISS